MAALREIKSFRIVFRQSFRVAEAEAGRVIPIRLLAVLCFFAASSPLRAQDAAAGADVARKYCSGCHQTEEQPRPILGFAPAFAKIANTKGMTQTSIEVFLKTPHEVMPNYVLSEREISDVAAYIASLRSEPSRRRKQPGSKMGDP